jgi:KDO2-lipid IV(A) lauroyltransferase
MGDFVMPSLGADMEAGTLIEWLVKPGDKVERGQTIAVVGTEKGEIDVEVEFLGEKTTMPGGPASLALMTGAGLFPIGSYFDGAGHRFEIQPEIPIPPAEERSERIRLATQAMADAFEDLIRVQPTDWHLFQPNWPSDMVVEEPPE